MNGGTGTDGRASGKGPQDRGAFPGLNPDLAKLVPERIHRKVARAMERDSRVMSVRSLDTHVLLDIAKQLDRALRNIRNHMMLTMSTERAIKGIQRYRDGLKDLDAMAKEVCEAAGIPYVSPVEEMEKRLRGETDPPQAGAPGDGAGQAAAPAAKAKK